jgi:hypothetical protein
MSVDAVFQGQLDRIAAGRQAQKAAFATGDSFRTRVDSAADFPYEDRILGASITLMDEALASGSFWSTAALQKWFSLHASYFQTDLSLASPYFTSYLATKGWRVPYEAAEAYYEATQSRLASQLVFPKGTLIASEADPTAAGMHKFMTWVDAATTETHVVVDGPLVNSYGVAMIAAEAASVTIAGTPKFTITHTDLTTYDYQLSAGDISNLDTKWRQVVLGQSLLDGGAAAAQATIPVAATTSFKAGCYVLLANAALTVFELVLVSSINAGVSIVATTPLINGFTTSDFAWPLVANAVWQAGTIATSGVINVWARPDRIIAL